MDDGGQAAPRRGHRESETTATVAGSPEQLFFDSSWEIVLSTPGAEPRRIPLQARSLRLTPRPEQIHDFRIDQGPVLCFWWDQGRLQFRSPEPALVLRNGLPCQESELKPGDRLEWLGHQARIRDRHSSRRATLECCSDPFCGRIWPLDEGPTLIGRPGKRHNHLILEHPTISRSHACLLWNVAGPNLLCETQRGLVMVDGSRLGLGECRSLREGALIQLGELLFRFQLLPEEVEESTPERLFLASLGGFSVRVGRRNVTEKQWRTQATRWLLARLAWEWGRPVAVDILLEEFWPEQAPERSKNNLNFCLSTLRQLLRGEGGLNYITRSNCAVQLQPDLLGEHDILAVLEALRQGQPLHALRLYSAPYLSGCYMDWAERLRNQLHEQLLSAGQSSLRELEKQSLFQEVLEASQLLLAHEPTCQLSYAAQMRAQIQLGQPHLALDAYQRCCQVCAEEVGAKPEREVEQARQAATRALADLS